MFNRITILKNDVFHVQIERPKDGVLVHGLFMDGFKWNDDTMQVEDSIKGEMNGVMPMLHMQPKMDYVADDKDYQAPLYKTAARAGVLSTTGTCSRDVVK